ncbi:MAG: DUF4835 family protein [Melioribacteraceae bacterium]|jgi:hypothetical protein|nr:DUF4835 family protein [Melioribacteraceae bacterium]
MKKYFVVIFLLLNLNVWGQELEATVQINTEQLQTVYRENLEVFQFQIEEYLNNTKFTSGNWEWPRIKCSFNIFFTAASNETNYTAQVVVNSTRPVEGSENRSLMLNVMDSKWSFIYEKNQSIYFELNDFDALTSFLDFYGLVIIAMDADSYEPFAGTTFFQEAMRISLMGGSTGYSDSWGSSSFSYNKRGFVVDATSAGFQQFRQDIFDYHYNGLDVFYREKETTYKSISKLVNNLVKYKNVTNRRSAFINAFFDAKSGEIIFYLKDYSDRSIFTKLIKVDPAHTSKYIEAEEK